ncbi:MAG: hypothetical protein FWG80_00555 [Alphaproteobacteria bacterium]|nr:hypothetical protein [Alphaproteobacteria bacterium]
MIEKSSIIAQRLMNLYRQAHVIDGGWRAVNAALMAEADPVILEELKKLPCGDKLYAHIISLQSGSIPRDSISRELMPYGGMMETHFVDIVSDNAKFSDNDLEILDQELANFHPSQENLDRIKALPFVMQFGDRWLDGVRSALVGNHDMLNRWKVVYDSARAFESWNQANIILSSPPTDRSRAEIQADLPEYETYLPMFGDAGQDLLRKLRAFTSSMQ